MKSRMNLTYNDKEFLKDKKEVGAEQESFPFPHTIKEVRKMNNTL